MYFEESRNYDQFKVYFSEVVDSINLDLHLNRKERFRNQENIEGYKDQIKSLVKQTVYCNGSEASMLVKFDKQNTGLFGSYTDQNRDISKTRILF